MDGYAPKSYTQSTLLIIIAKGIHSIVKKKKKLIIRNSPSHLGKNYMHSKIFTFGYRFFLKKDNPKLKQHNLKSTHLKKNVQ